MFSHDSTQKPTLLDWRESKSALISTAINAISTPWARIVRLPQKRRSERHLHLAVGFGYPQSPAKALRARTTFTKPERHMEPELTL